MRLVYFTENLTVKPVSVVLFGSNRRHNSCVRESASASLYTH